MEEEEEEAEEEEEEEDEEEEEEESEDDGAADADVEDVESAGGEDEEEGEHFVWWSMCTNDWALGDIVAFIQHKHSSVRHCSQIHVGLRRVCFIREAVAGHLVACCFTN